MYKRIISLVTIISLVMSAIVPISISAADDYIYLRVDGKTVSNDKSVKITDGGYLIPLRQVASRKNASIVWLQDLLTAEVTYNSHKTLIAAGKSFVYIDNQKTDVLRRTEIIDSSLYVGEDVIEMIFGLTPYYEEDLSILDFVDPSAVKNNTSADTDDEYEKNKISVISCEDTWVAGGTNADKNNGSMERMPSRYLPGNPAAYQESYIKFDISGLSAEKLNSVTFEGFICVAETGSTTIEKWLYEIDPSSWEENTLTWNNKPAHGDLVAIASGRSQNKIGVYITDYIKEKIAAGVVCYKRLIYQCKSKRKNERRCA